MILPPQPPPDMDTAGHLLSAAIHLAAAGAAMLGKAVTTMRGPLVVDRGCPTMAGAAMAAATSTAAVVGSAASNSTQ
jgi:hypothetical protein